MKYIKIIIFMALFSIIEGNATEWRTYLSYDNPQQIAPTEKFIYVMANNGLYSYNRNDHSIYTFSKSNVLSDVKIKFIVWANSIKKLAIIYNSGNIDLLNADGTEVENISDYYTKPMTEDKTINNYVLKDNMLLLATNFGVLKIDLRKGEIMETYKLNSKIAKVDIVDGKIYALSSENTLFIGDMKENLLDLSKWEKKNNDYGFPDRTAQVSAEDREIVNSLNIDGPKNNQISRLKFFNDRLLIAAGGRMEGIEYVKDIPATLQEYSNGEWFYYENYNPVATIRYTREVTDIAVDPTNNKHIFVSTYGNGLYEFENGKQLNNFTNTNTDVIKSATSSSNYVRTGGVCFYPSTNDLYFLNMECESALLKYKKDGGFERVYHSELYGLNGNNNKSWAGLKGTILDSRNLLWFVNDNHLTPALYKYNPETDKVQRFNKFINQDGTTISDLNYVRCVTEDLEHNIWIGTEQGPLLLTPEMMDDPNAGFIQVKVPRNDGTNYADYLLSGVDISCIAVDAAGRKWFGTNGNGVYLISEDNMKQLEHFTTDNSCLLDNNIRDIAINNKTGEVFFASNSGLCSVISDATEANEEMTSETVWAYPNPVTPDFQGEISIVGLAINSTVTITTSSGHVVATGKSVGGSFKWNGCDKSGKRVASGVYMVHTATKEGKSGVVTKIAFIK